MKIKKVNKSSKVYKRGDNKRRRVERWERRKTRLKLYLVDIHDNDGVEEISTSQVLQWITAHDIEHSIDDVTFGYANAIMCGLLNDNLVMRKKSQRYNWTWNILETPSIQEKKQAQEEEIDKVEECCQAQCQA